MGLRFLVRKTNQPKLICSLMEKERKQKTSVHGL